MKKILKYISLALAIPTLFSSCLKDDAIIGPDAPGALANIIEFKNPTFLESGTSSKIPLYLLSFDMNPTGQLVLEVNYAGANTAPQDINVKVKVDNSLLDAYKADQGDEFFPLPSSQYNISTNDVVIKKGERVGKFVVDLKPSLFTFDHSYALGFTIESSSVGTISGNFGKIMVGIVPKNLYDGSYKMVQGTVLRYTGGKLNEGDALNGSMAGNPNVTLKTIDGTTVEIGNLRWAGGTSGIAGIDNLRAKIDPVTNEVTMSSLGGPTLKNIAGKVNKYDPETKTFTLNFDWAQTTNKREVLDLKITYDSVRE